MENDSDSNPITNFDMHKIAYNGTLQISSCPFCKNSFSSQLYVFAQGNE